MRGALHENGSVGGTYLDSKRALEGERMPFCVEKRLIFLLAPLRYQVLIHKNYHIVARILFDCQRVSIGEEWKHSIEQSRSIESP